MKKAAAIQVSYKFCDGYHVFKSDQLKELCVASKDPEVAFRDVTASIKLILKLTMGIDCEVEALQSFEEFIEDALPEKRTAQIEPFPNRFADTFRVYACA